MEETAPRWAKEQSGRAQIASDTSQWGEATSRPADKPDPVTRIIAAMMNGNKHSWSGTSLYHGSSEITETAGLKVAKAPEELILH